MPGARSSPLMAVKLVTSGCAARIVLFKFAVATAALSSTAAILFVSAKIPGSAFCTWVTMPCNWSETGGVSTARSQAESSPGLKIL